MSLPASLLPDFRILQRARGSCDASDFNPQPIHPSQPLPHRLPITLPGQPTERFASLPFSHTPPFVRTTLPDGATITQYGAHISPSNFLVAPLSLYYRDTLADHRALTASRPFRKARHHRGDLISAVAKGAYNYYHFLIDALPKLAAFPELIAANTPIYIHASSRFAQQALALLGLSNIIDAATTQTVRVHGQTFATTPTSAPGLASPWAIDWLRTTFLPLAEAPSSPTPKIFLNRRNASCRSIVNNDDVLHWATDHGFVEILPETLTFAQQVGLFAQAREIIAPHGAGLTNLAFAPSDCRVIEFLADTTARNPSVHDEVCYWHIANVRAQRYGALECLSVPADGPNLYHIHVDTTALSALYDTLTA